MNIKIKKSILFLAIRAAAAIFLSFFIILYLINLINKKSQDILDKKIQLLARLHQQETQLTLLADSKTVEPYLAKIKTALPMLEEGAVAFSSIIDELASKNSIRASFNVGVNQAVLNFSLILDGNLENFTNFFDDLEKLPYFITIKSLDFTGSNINNSAQAIINGSLYTR